MKQKTAVDWLYSMMFEKNDRITKEEYEQAKEIEKQQIIDAVNWGLKYRASGFNPELYYNETI